MDRFFALIYYTNKIESNGRVEGFIQNDNNLPMVSEFISHLIPEQEGPFRREDNAFSPGRLFPRV